MCLLYFLWFFNMILSNLLTACNTRRDVTTACYFHTVKITLLIFSHCENNSMSNIKKNIIIPLFTVFPFVFPSKSRGLNSRLDCWIRFSIHIFHELFGNILVPGSFVVKNLFDWDQFFGPAFL